jgi:hypothetical protein
MSIRDDLFSLGFENFEAKLDAALSPSRATKSPGILQGGANGSPTCVKLGYEGARAT